MDDMEKEFEEFRKEAQSEYFKMQMREDRTKKTLYVCAILLMIFLPLLIVSYRNYNRFTNDEKNKLRLQEDHEEIVNFAESLVMDSKFLTSLNFTNDIAKVPLEKFYDGTYSKQLSKPYFDEEYTHQCLGYFLIVRDNSLYHIYVTDYCKMDE